MRSWLSHRVVTSMAMRRVVVNDGAALAKQFGPDIGADAGRVQVIQRRADVDRHAHGDQR
jgi:hypothetical protein